MNTILVATDFSENAKVALDVAKKMSVSYDAKIVLINAYHPPVVDPNMPLELSIVMSQEAENIAKEALNKVVDECRKEGISCEGKVVLGAASEVVLDEIKSQKPLLTLMGRSGTGGWIDRLLGSVAVSVVTHTDSPVLVIPPNTHSLQINKILYATELEHFETESLDFVFDFAEHFGASVTLLKVIEDFQVDVFNDEEFIKAIRARYLSKPYELKFIEAATITDGLQRYADEEQYDLLVMATRKRDWLSKIINPSITNKMILNTHTPLLVCHIED